MRAIKVCSGGRCRAFHSRIVMAEAHRETRKFVGRVADRLINTEKQRGLPPRIPFENPQHDDETRQSVKCEYFYLNDLGCDCDCARQSTALPYTPVLSARPVPMQKAGHRPIAKRSSALHTWEMQRSQDPLQIQNCASKQFSYNQNSTTGLHSCPTLEHERQIGR
jgi:hypothetical protein